MEYQQIDGAKMIYLIKRKAETAREELVAHWFANHMPLVIKAQSDSKAAGRRHAHRYIATLFDFDSTPASVSSEREWDGMAQLWWDSPLRRPKAPHGTRPTDMFQEKAEPYLPWATKEYCVIDGSEHLPTGPNKLNAFYPATRSGFFKVTYLIRAKPESDYAAFMKHWLEVHVPNVKQVMAKVDGFRYTVSHSLEPELDPYAGMAELYFHDRSGWAGYRERIEPDGMEQWVDGPAVSMLYSHVEMVGIP